MGGEARKQAAEALLDAANAAASRAQAAWLFFLGVSAFLFITISSVTHATLLLDTPVRLPLFQVNMRAYAFFLVAPVIYVFVHLGVLVQHRTLRAKLEAFNHALEALKPEDARHLRTRLNIYTYAQFMAGGERGAFALVVAIIAWLTLAIMPLLLLAYFQASFLPYHDTLVTWANRLTLTADAIAILLSGLFCTRLKEPGTWRAFLLRVRHRLEALPKALRHLRQTVPHVAVALWQGLRLRFSNRKSFVAMLNTTFAWLAIFYAFLVATVPGEGIDEWLCGKDGGDRFWCRAVPWTITEKEDRKSTRTASAWFITPAYGWDGRGFGDCCSNTSFRYAFLPTAWLFERGANHVSGLSNSPLGLARNLIITNTELNRKGRVSLRGRDLRYATLTHVVLRHADFTGADLSHANFTGSDLTAARFGCANTGRKKRIVEKSGVIFPPTYFYYDIKKQKCSNLIYTSFQKSTLNESIFYKVNYVDGISGDFIDIPIVSFEGSSMIGAKFEDVDISGWSFYRSDLTGSYFKNVNAQLADFSDSYLFGATFADTKLDAAMFGGAKGANLAGAVFEGSVFRAEAADFGGARIWHTKLPLVSPEGLHQLFLATNFVGLQVSPPEKDILEGLKKHLLQLANAALRQQLLQKLAPVLNGEPWQGIQRAIWEALREPPLKCRSDEIRNSLLQAARLRARVLARRFCHAERKPAIISIGKNEVWRTILAPKWANLGRFEQVEYEDMGRNDVNLDENAKNYKGGEVEEDGIYRDKSLIKRIKNLEKKYMDRIKEKSYNYRSYNYLGVKFIETGPYNAYNMDSGYIYDIEEFIKYCRVYRIDLKGLKKSYMDWKKKLFQKIPECPKKK